MSKTDGSSINDSDLSETTKGSDYYMKKTKNAIKDKFGNSSSMKAVSRISDKDIYLKKEEDKAIIEDLNQEQIRCLKLGRDKMKNGLYECLGRLEAVMG